MAVGGAGFVAALAGGADTRIAVVDAGSVLVFLAVDGRLMGHLVMADALRAGTAELLAGLRGLGIARTLMTTGDRHAVAEAATEGWASTPFAQPFPPIRRCFWSWPSGAMAR